jgi:hypothetical protein
MVEDILRSIPETAKRLGGISPWTVRAWLHQRRMRKTKVGKRTMVAESEIIRFLESCCEETDARPEQSTPSSNSRPQRLVGPNDVRK